jgi:hypothetical protein
VDTKYGTYFVSPVWRLEFGRGLPDCRKNCAPLWYSKLEARTTLCLNRIHKESNHTLGEETALLRVNLSNFHLNNFPQFVLHILVQRGGVRSTRSLGPTMTARGQSIGISIGTLPQTLIMSRLNQLSRLGARI